MTPMWWTRDLLIGDAGPDVEAVQRILGLVTTGDYDLTTALAVRGVQRLAGLETTGAVDNPTAVAIGPRSTDSLTPQWYQGEPLYPGDQGYDLVVPHGDESWLRRFQGHHGVAPTGVIDETTARLLGALEAR